MFSEKIVVGFMDPSGVMSVGDEIPWIAATFMIVAYEGIFCEGQASACVLIRPKVLHNSSPKFTASCRV